MERLIVKFSQKVAHALQEYMEGMNVFLKTTWIQHLCKNKSNRIFCDNYRRIHLLSITGKILARLILKRIIKHDINEIYPESQCAFRSGRDTMDMILPCQVTENVREKNQDLYIF